MIFFSFCFSLSYILVFNGKRNDYNDGDQDDDDDNDVDDEGNNTAFKAHYTYWQQAINKYINKEKKNQKNYYHQTISE